MPTVHIDPTVTVGAPAETRLFYPMLLFGHNQSGLLAYSPACVGRARGALAAPCALVAVGRLPPRTADREGDAGFTVRRDLIFSRSRSSSRLRDRCISLARIRTNCSFYRLAALESQHAEAHKRISTCQQVLPTIPCRLSRVKNGTALQLQA